MSFKPTQDFPSLFAPFFLLGIYCLFFSCTHRVEPDTPLSVIPTENWIRREARLITASLSAEQKASQVLMTGIDGKVSFPDYLRSHYRGCVPGAIVLFKYNIADTPERVHRFLSESSTALMQLGSPVPVLFAIDHEGGEVYRTGPVTTRLPSARDVASSFPPHVAGSLYYHAAHQLKLLGIRMNLFPVLEVQSTASETFMASRLFSTDPEVASRYAEQVVHAHRKSSTIAVIKHFPGIGSSDPHHSVPVVPGSADEIQRSVEKTFRALFKREVDAVLVSHAIVPALEQDVPFCLSRKGVQALLREQFHFDGLVLTDDISMDAIKNQGYSSSQAALMALEAGCDMIMTSDTDIRTIAGAILQWAQTENVNMCRLDEAVTRILSLKIKTGLVSTARGRYYRSWFGSSASADFDSKTYYLEKKKGDMLLEMINEY